MITAVSEEQKVVSGLKIGADDYIVKPFILPNLLARIEAVLRRSKWQSETASNQNKKLNKDVNINLLTPKEKEVLSLLAKGANNQEIAKQLFVQDVTIKTHLNSIFKKLKVSNRTQAVLLAMEINLIN
jgi:DNA-binding NarL/FixJ family response regulator